MSSNQLRQRVVDLYKTLHYMGREYPTGSKWFHDRLKRAFMKNVEETDPQKISKMCDHGDFVVKELEAMYSLRKYRAMKQRYYDEQDEEEALERLRQLKKLATNPSRDQSKS
ncbi:hypothetical protein PRIPAC_88985 [Pristionchus pacificus]|uniref:Uncharacterized protein n=1 Tax=Pristionchus pacificus TaxID=54126 RepID=A0A2A6CJ09_PRIPA|nr:hypothetical protein PRIPAC_88985 [Pristionchus pacificus]|eukprot:PDM78068.1 hypothetical protein PRIPAC_30453 [Pristionchus pacificus]